MLTNAGKENILKYMAGYINQLADTISIGIGSTPESPDDKDLVFETDSQAIQQVGLDLANNKIIYKVSLPQEIAGSIKELGLWANRQQSLDGSRQNMFLTRADEVNEIWTVGDWVEGRIGTKALSIPAAASSTAVTQLSGFSRDLSRYNILDEVSIAWEAIGNITGVNLRLGIDDDNYFSYSLSNTGAGYKINKIKINQFTKTGTLDWSNLKALSLRVTAGTGGGQIKLEGIRINTMSLDGAVLISRRVLDQEIVKEANAPKDIEYHLDVAINTP